MTPEEFKHNTRIPGWFGLGDIKALSELSSNINNGIIIELGSMHGRSAYCLSKSSPTSKIFCFDYWGDFPCVTADGIERPNSLDLFKSFIIDCPNITPIQLSMYEKTIPIWEEPVDLVFLDAGHRNPADWEIIKFCLPIIKKVGILCGHDYYHKDNSDIIHYPDVNENITRLEEILNQKVTPYKYSCMWSFTI